MSKLDKAFTKGKAVIAFLTAGDPTIGDSVRYVQVMEEAGADLIEIGVPFSDPIADGPVIMEADVRALAGHIHLPQAMEEARAIRRVSEIPLVFLTYFNPVFSYGAERFSGTARKSASAESSFRTCPSRSRTRCAPLRKNTACLSSR